MVQWLKSHSVQQNWPCEQHLCHTLPDNWIEFKIFAALSETIVWTLRSKHQSLITRRSSFRKFSLLWLCKNLKHSSNNECSIKRLRLRLIFHNRKRLQIFTYLFKQNVIIFFSPCHQPIYFVFYATTASTTTFELFKPKLAAGSLDSSPSGTKTISLLVDEVAV